MISSSVFSGKLTTTVNGASAKNFSYDGSMSTKNNKVSFDIATDIDGAKDKIAIKNISPQALSSNPKFIEFMKKMNDNAHVKKNAKPWKRTAKRKWVKRARKTKRS